MIMTTPIRILEILPGGPVCGGIENFILNYYRHIDRSRVQMDFLVHYKAKGVYDEEIKRLGGKIYYFSAREDKKIFSYLVQLRRFFAEHPEYKVIHGHMPGFAPLYFTVARLSGVPVRIAHSHVTATEPTPKGRVLGLVMRLIPLTANVYWACGEQAGKFLYKNRPYTVIKNAVSFERFAPDLTMRTEMRRRLGLENKFVVGNVGRCSPQKNQHFLLQIFVVLHRKHPNSALLMIGEGALREELEVEIQTLGLADSVIFLKNQADIENYYQAMDVFVLPSLFEGLPVVQVEALACGLPAVASSTTECGTLKASALQYVELNRSPEEWAEMILNTKRPPEEQNRAELMQQGYEINSAAKELEERFLTLYQEAANKKQKKEAET